MFVGKPTTSKNNNQRFHLESTMLAFFGWGQFFACHSGLWIVFKNSCLIFCYDFVHEICLQSGVPVNPDSHLFFYSTVKCLDILDTSFSQIFCIAVGLLEFWALKFYSRPFPQQPPKCLYCDRSPSQLVPIPHHFQMLSMFIFPILSTVFKNFVPPKYHCSWNCDGTERFS